MDDLTPNRKMFSIFVVAVLLMSLLIAAPARADVVWKGISWDASYGTIAVDGAGNLVTTTQYCNEYGCWGVAHYSTPDDFRAAATPLVEAKFVDEGPGNPGAQLWMEDNNPTTGASTQFGAWQRPGYDNYKVYWWDYETGLDGWVDTGVVRTAGPHTLALSMRADRTIDYRLDGALVFSTTNITPNYFGEISLAGHSDPSSPGQTVLFTDFKAETGAPITVTTDKANYGIGETVYITGTVTSGGLPVVGADVGVQVQNELGVNVFEQQLKTDEAGTYETTLIIPEFFQTGLYTVYAAYQSERAQAQFTISTAVVTLNAISPQYYTRGATVSYSGTVIIGGSPAPDGTTVEIVVKDHLDVGVLTEPRTTTSGAFSGSFVIGSSGAEGLWTLYASSGDGSAQTGFYLDVSAPASSVSTPGQGSTVNSIPVISGVASDPNLADGNPGSGVSSVMITLQRVSDSLYWTGSAWGSLTWLAASYSDGSWSYDSSGVGWMAGSYIVVSKAADVAGNVETPGAGNTFTLSEWISVGGLTPSRPAACYFNSHLYTIVRDNGADPKGSGIWMRVMDDIGVWSGWTSIGGLTPSAPACTVFNNRLELFVRDANGNLWMQSMDTNGIWTGWSILSGSSPSSPAVAAFNGYLYLAVRGAPPYQDVIWLNRMDTGGSWSGWTQVDGLTLDSPSLAAFNNHLYLVVSDISGGIWVRSMDSAEVWSDWTNLNGVTSAPPSMAVYGDQLYLFVRDISGGIWSNTMDTSGTWSGWQSPGGLTMSGPVGCATDNSLYVIVNDVVGGLWFRKIL